MGRERRKRAAAPLPEPKADPRSAKRRAEGTRLYQQALTYANADAQLNCLTCAEHHYRQALDFASIDEDRAKALRNLAVVSSASGDVQHTGSRFTEAIKHWSTALSLLMTAMGTGAGMGRDWTAGLAQQLERWSQKLFALLEADDSQDDSESGLDLIQLAAWQFERSLPKHQLHAQRVQVYLDLVWAALAQATAYLKRGEPAAAAQLLSSLDGLTSHVEQLVATAQYGAEELAELQDVFREKQAQAQAHAALFKITCRINTVLFDQENPDLAAGWQCMDDLQQNLTHARAMCLAMPLYAPIEGETRALIGQIWDSMLLDKDAATRHYRSAMDIAMGIAPRPVHTVWYQRLRKRMAEMQAQVASQEQAELDKLLASIKPKMDRLKKLQQTASAAAAGGDAQREGVLKFLEAVRDDLDMDAETRKKLDVLPDGRAEAKARVKKLITTFIAALHPDRHAGKGAGVQHSRKLAAFTQVTAHLNCLYESFKGD